MLATPQSCCARTSTCMARWTLPAISLIGYGCAFGALCMIPAAGIKQAIDNDPSISALTLLQAAGISLLVPVGTTAIAGAIKTMQAARVLCTNGSVAAKEILQQSIQSGGLIRNTFLPSITEMISASHECQGYGPVE